MGNIACGSFTTDGSGNATVNLGWEPQYVMLKPSSSVDDWQIFDTSRNFIETTNKSNGLRANLSNAEVSNWIKMGATATGFATISATSNSATYIYLAIRRPNKPPTAGTQVYNAIARTGTGAAATITGVGFAPDLVMSKIRASTLNRGFGYFDKLRGVSKFLVSSDTGTEQTDTFELSSFNMDGYSCGADNQGNAYINDNTSTYINHFFKRAVGVFDICCYTGTGTSSATITHGLGVVPELIIAKKRSAALDWYVSFLPSPPKYANLNSSAAALAAVGWFTASATTFDTSNISTNNGGATYVCYLFATKAGISKVGSYTGNGTTQNIDMGFNAGCRFFLVKRTDSTGSWWVFDSTRGITAAADNALQLNSTAAEITTADAIDNYAAGITVNQETTCNINVNLATYIYLAIA